MEESYAPSTSIWSGSNNIHLSVGQKIRDSTKHSSQVAHRDEQQSTQSGTERRNGVANHGERNMGKAVDILLGDKRYGGE